jgi:hypothetical protein
LSRRTQLTDPLTGKQLVEKSYEYVDKLTKECAKAIVQEFNSAHRKFQPSTLGKEIGDAIVQWFARRDRNLVLRLDSIVSQQPNVTRLKFNGNTKDAQFSIGATVGTFSIPAADGTQSSFVKTLTFSVEKNSFAKPK